MNATFHTEYFDFTPEEIRRAAQAGKLLAAEVEFNRSCNYRCPYCYADDGTPEARRDDGILTGEEIDHVMEQAAALGARKIVILGGEPLLCRTLEERLRKIAVLGMRPEVFTNGSLLDAERAAMLWRYGARVVLKFNSLVPEVQERMTGVKGALDKCFRAVGLLREAGYGREEGLLAASSVICSENVDGMAELWRYLRREKIIPYFEIMTPQGRMLRNRHLHVAPERLKQVFDEIAAIDRGEFQREWEVQPPLVGGCCFRHHYSCFVNAAGEVMPCVGVTAVLGNVRERPLAEIIGESTVLRDLKDYRSRIKEPCRSCDKIEHCYGCRGTAYQMTGDYLAADPLCWRNAARADRIKTLPYDIRSAMPHAAPMLMVGRILAAGEANTVEAVIAPDNRFLNSAGVLDRCAVPELAAQAAAAAEAFRQDGRSVPGMLVGMSDVRFHSDIHAGDVLEIAVREAAVLDEWHIVRFSIVRRGEPAVLAEGELKLCITGS